MPLFMFLSGFSSYKPDIEWNVVEKRAVQLLIPYVFFTLLICLVNGRNLIDALVVTPAYWFLLVLFFVIVINTFCFRLAKWVKISQEFVSLLMFIILIVITPGLKILSLNVLYFHFFFFSIGYYLKKHRDIFESIIVKRLVIGFLTLLFVVLGYFFKLGCAPSFMSTIPPALYYMITGVVGSLLFFGLFKTKLDIFLPFIGQLGIYTLGIYVIHCFIRLIISEYIIDKFIFIPSFILVIIIFVLLTVVSYYISCLMARTPIMCKCVGIKESK